MSKHKKLQDWEQLLVGKTFNWLTVVSIKPRFINNKKRGYFATCKCSCGNFTDVEIPKLLKGLIYSCGCYRRSKEFINKQHAWQLDEDKFNSACEKNKQFYINNPERIKLISEQNKQYWSDHPEIVSERTNKRRKFYIDNPDKLKELSDNRIAYFKNNPDAHIKLSESLKKYFSDNPDEGTKRSIKYLEWYNSHPDEVAEMHYKQHLWLQDAEKVKECSEKRKHTLQNNPSIQEDINNKIKQWMSNNRVSLLEIGKRRSETNSAIRANTDFNILLEIIHPKYIESLVNGNITSIDLVETRCPKCNNYCVHKLHNVFIFNTATFKYGHPPLCTQCVNSLSTSHYETEISDFIKTFYTGKLVSNVRNVINPLELDLYYPDKNIAIEFNGDYWHSSLYKSKEYHYNKFIKCYNLEISLVSIFESKWKEHKQQIQDYLLDLFNDRLNSLSLKDNSMYMNNNYPSPLLTIESSCNTEDSYNYGDSVVYTCGYSKILGSKND